MTVPSHIMGCEAEFCPLKNQCRRANCESREGKHDFSHTLYSVVERTNGVVWKCRYFVRLCDEHL